MTPTPPPAPCQSVWPRPSSAPPHLIVTFYSHRSSAGRLPGSALGGRAPALQQRWNAPPERGASSLCPRAHAAFTWRQWTESDPPRVGVLPETPSPRLLGHIWRRESPPKPPAGNSRHLNVPASVTGRGCGQRPGLDTGGQDGAFRAGPCLLLLGSAARPGSWGAAGVLPVPLGSLRQGLRVRPAQPAPQVPRD